MNSEYTTTKIKPLINPKISLNILVVGLASPPETFLINLIQGLLDAGIKITVASRRYPYNNWKHMPNFHWISTPRRSIYRLLQKACIKVSHISKDSVYYNHQPLVENISKRLERAHRLQPFRGQLWDIVYFPWIFSAIDYINLIETGMPILVSCRGSQINVMPHSPEFQSMNEKLHIVFREVSAVHCVSHDIENEAVQYGLEQSKSQIIYPAVDPNFFQPLERNSSNSIFKIITTGSLTWRKGYEYLLMGIHAAVTAGLTIQLDIIGEGSERQRVLYTIHDLGLENHVHMHGKLPPAKVLELLQQADCFVLSSLSEGVSNAVLEAMACALPIITTDCGGMTEAVDSGVEGIVVPVRDPAAIAQAIQKLALDPVLAKRMGVAGRERILKQFSLRDQIDQFVTLLHHLKSQGMHSS